MPSLRTQFGQLYSPGLSNSSALRQGSSVSVQGNKDSVASDIASPHPVILQRDSTSSPSGAGSPTASARIMAVASPKRMSTTSLARDPRTGKGTRDLVFMIHLCIQNGYGHGKKNRRKGREFKKVNFIENC